MGFIAKIRTVARFELRTLFRSWFFRIFSALTLFMLLGLNIGILTEGGDNNWAIKSIASNIPYMNMAFLNIAQALLAIFLASDFLKRDKKLDTTEVIYTRSMTNWEYVWGKTFGVLFVFGVLNILVFLMTFIINLVVSGVEVDYMAYLIYPALIGFPTLVFTLGLAFVLMSVLRNQAVTLVVLLGLAAVSLFFVKERADHLFDYMAFTLPMMWSDLIGSGNLLMILLHRGIYLSLGLSFVFATILLLKRLPQSRPYSVLSFVLMLGLFVLGIGGGISYYSATRDDHNTRAELQQLNNTVADASIVGISSYEIKLEHKGNSISALANLQLTESAGQLPKELLFSLNPGLQVVDLKINGAVASFSREQHLIRIQKPDLGESQNITLEFAYEGYLDERICNLDISEESLKVKHGPDFIIASPKRYAILSEDYVLMTPEVVWYPIAGGTFGTTLSVKPARQFSEFVLEVKTMDHLIPVSQGDVNQVADSYTFNPNSPLQGMSLTIGPFQQKRIEVDGIQVELNYVEEHGGFLGTLELLKDTLPILIRETLGDYERSMGLSYPFDYLKFTEAPVQFFAHKRVWTKAYDYVQAGVLFYPENLSFLKRGNLFKELDAAVNRALDNDQMVTDADLQAQVFNNLVRSNFLEIGGNDFRMMGRGGDRMGGQSRNNPKPYNLFPNYFTYTNNFTSNDYQLINASLESFLTAQTSQMGFGGMGGGVTNEEKANLALSENSFKRLLELPDEKQVLPLVIDAKGKQLFYYLEAVVGSAMFTDFLVDLLNQTRFSNLDFADFSGQMAQIYGIDMDTFLNNWYAGSAVPTFLVTGVQNFEIQEGDNTVYQVFFTISNTGDIDGLINVIFRTGGGGRGFGGMGHGGGQSQSGSALTGRDEATDKLFVIPAKTAHKYGMILDEQPRMMSVNTLISANLPISLSFPFPDIEKRNMDGREGFEVVELITTVAQPNELIVDNEDPGFSVHEEATSNRLSSWLGIDQKETEFKYQSMNFWRPPMSWSLSTSSGYYGDYIRSAYYTRSGEGERQVSWEIEITEPGYYEVSAFLDDMIARMSRFRGRGGDRGGRGGGGGGQSDISDVYHYTVYHDQGEEEVAKALSNIEDGWNLLGSFYFSKGTAKVMLTNENSGRMVVADAIKWEKQ